MYVNVFALSWPSGGDVGPSGPHRGPPPQRQHPPPRHRHLGTSAPRCGGRPSSATSVPRQFPVPFPGCSLRYCPRPRRQASIALRACPCRYAFGLCAGANLRRRWRCGRAVGGRRGRARLGRRERPYGGPQRHDRRSARPSVPLRFPRSPRRLADAPGRLPPTEGKVAGRGECIGSRSD